jgi:SAM-dependent methyltransferase
MVELGRARTGDVSGTTWRRADLAHQPFDDASMDLVASSFGLIFGEDPAECVSEVARVLNSAGRLLFTAWVDEGYMAEMTRRMMAFFPEAPPSGPLRWGSKAFIADQLAPHFLGVEIERLRLPWAFSSARAGREYLQSVSPAHVAACAALGDRAEEMMDAVEAHLEGYSRADGSVAVEAEYWLVDAHRIP